MPCHMVETKSTTCSKDKAKKSGVQNGKSKAYKQTRWNIQKAYKMHTKRTVLTKGNQIKENRFFWCIFRDTFLL